MKCPKCLLQGKDETCRIVRRSPEGFFKDVFRCYCGEVYSREELIMAEEDRIDEALKEVSAIFESNQSQEIDLDNDPVRNGWVGSDGLP